MSADAPPSTTAELNERLRSLLGDAYANDVDVEGGWECRHDDGRPDWDIVVTEVEKDAASD